MAHSLPGRPVRLVPLARPPVQRTGAVRILRRGTRQEHIAEKVVVAVPLAAVIERDDEEVPPLQLLQLRSAILPSRDGVAQRAGQSVED